MLTLYVTPEGPLHAIPAGTKLLFLAASGAGLYFAPGLQATVSGLVLTLALYRLAGKPVWYRLADLKSLAILMVGLFVLQGWLAGWFTAAVIVSRMATLVLIANLVTLTSRLDDMTQAMTPALRPMRLIGLPPERSAFAIALVLRFVPVLLVLAGRLQDAWHARGGGKARWPLAVPLLVNGLRMTDQVAEAVASRGGLNTEKPQPVSSSTDTKEQTHA